MPNPLLSNGNVFRKQGTSGGMTVTGTINKSIILWFLLAISAAFSWANAYVTINFLWPLIIVGLVLVVIIAIKNSLAPYLSPLYAIVEGLFLGAISYFFEIAYPGIVTSAIFFTIAVMFCMLILYKTRIIKASSRFIQVVVIATSAIMFVYIINIALIFFTGTGIGLISIQNSSLLAIGINLFAIVIAALNLIIDFHIIESGANHGAPKYMEWYGAFALMVTLIWLYIEILRIIARTR
jgi:uncharacterized YccA/Bax inhibitor family protein